MVMQDLDNGWAWVVAVAVFAANLFVYGFAYSIGMFYAVFIDVFHGNKGTTAWITSLNYGMLCATGPLGSFLISKCGCRVTLIIGTVIGSAGLLIGAFAFNIPCLIVTIGVVTGSGFGISYMAATVVISLFFVKYRTLAMGLTNAGAGVGTFIYPWIIKQLLAMYSWRGALMVCSALHLHLVVFALLIPKHSPMKLAENQDKQTKETDDNWSHIYAHFAKNYQYILLCLNNFVFCIGIFVVYTHLITYAHSLEIGETVSSLLISVLGASGVIGRLSLGCVGQMSCVSVSGLYAASYFIAGLATVISGFWNTVPGIITTMSMFGFFSAAFGTLNPEVACELVGVKALNLAYGIMMFSSSIGIIIGPPIAGTIYDVTRSYPLSFYFGGGCMILSAILMTPIFISPNKAQQISVQ